MPDPVADGARHPLECADLVDDRLFDVLGLLALDLAPAKAPHIEEARMRADPDTVLLGPRHGFEHDERVATVKAARDIRRRDDLQHLGVTAHRPGAKALAHVAIEVDHIHRVPPHPFRGPRASGPHAGGTPALLFSIPYMGGI